ncbi:MAG: TIGR04013 family B12-binding domain/radical SAM domain-containing protein [Methanoregula sp.]|nr:TIGR04013 family B12-binding domain/radical SAM domain-containing protein [Methanoregula sp.]
MKVNWRLIHSARNSYVALYAACEQSGFILYPVKEPAGEVTCYSLNTINEPINEPGLRDEITNADCVTIIGGSHATAMYQDVIRYADYVVVGEGEYTLPRLLAAIEQGTSTAIPGVATKDHYEPADTDVRLDAYPAFSEMKGYVEISRGCPFSCGYCQTPQMFGHCMRHRSIDAVAQYANRYEHARFVSPNAFAYGSDGVHPRFDKIKRLFHHLRYQIFFGTFPSEVRPEFVCDTSIELVTQFCANSRLHFGAQSGSNAVLQHLKRGHTVEDVVRAVELCCDHGLTPVVDVILGFPFETDEDQLATVRLIKWVTGHGMVHAHHFMPLPGTPLSGTFARPIPLKTAQLCGKLALSGKLTGSWSDTAIKPHS